MRRAHRSTLTPLHPLAAAALLAFLLAGCGGGAGPDGAEQAGDDQPQKLVLAEQAGDDQPQKLVLGLVPSREADVLIDNVDPLAEALTEKLGIPVESFVPQDYTGLVEAMGSGNADIGLIPPFASMLGNERYGIETLLISKRGGKATYRAQWMTHDPSLCTEPPTFDDRGLSFCEAPIEVVRGRVVAFTDPTSTSGHLFPALQLLDAGINPETDVQSIYIGGHDASAIAVMNGDVEIGVSFDDVRHLLLDEYPEIGETAIVFNHSPPIPNDGVTVRPDLPAEIKEAIKEAFLALVAEQQELPREEQLLWRIYEIDGFAEFEPGIHQPVRRAFREMREKIDLNS